MSRIVEDMTPEKLVALVERRLCGVPVEIYYGPDVNPTEQLEAGIVSVVLVIRTPPVKKTP